MMCVGVLYEENGINDEGIRFGRISQWNEIENNELNWRMTKQVPPSYGLTDYSSGTLGTETYVLASTLMVRVHR